MSSVGNAYANTTVSRARQLLGITVRTDSEGKSGIRNLWDFTEVTL
jgi:hypothetical protein